MHSDTPSTATLDCLRQLIGFDTTSRNSNLALIDWAGALLEGHGAKLRRAYNADRTKANLFATFGEGPGGIVLSGHSDVVPTNGQPWTSDPFKAEIRNGRLYGRGACDMKGFIGVVLGHAAQFAAAPARLGQGVVWHRGRLFSALRHAHHHLRPRQHRAGPQGRRVRGPVATEAVRTVHGQAGTTTERTALCMTIARPWPKQTA